MQLINAKVDERSKSLNLDRFADLAIVLQCQNGISYNFVMPVMKTKQAVWYVNNVYSGWVLA